MERAPGWRVHHHPLVGSTNDEAVALAAAGAPARTAVVADAQSAGRGREGRAFLSPPGGLYVSMLVEARPADLPGPVVAATALAAAEAVEEVSGLHPGIKWPNDLWVRGRKLAGLLLESGPRGTGLVVVGLGLNLDRVPAGLGPGSGVPATSLADELGRALPTGDLRPALLGALLGRVDRHLGALADPPAREAVAEAWRARLTLRGARVTWREAGSPRAGVFLDASPTEGLEVLDDAAGRRRLRGELISDLRPA